MAARRDDFEEFVVVCSDRLLRTAYLLTLDAALAEDLLDRALTRAWMAWGHLEAQPEPYVRGVIVNTYATWWRRRRGGEGPRRQRAALVLRFVDDLSVEDVADTLGCSEHTVERLTRHPPEQDLKAEAAGLEPLLTPHARARAVIERGQASGARRRGGLGVAMAVAAVAAVAAIVVVPPLVPDAPSSQLPLPIDPMVDSPPRLGGAQMPLKVRVDNADYQFARGQEADQRSGRILLPVAPSASRQVLAWSTSPGTTGEVVITVDGEVVRHALAGQLDYGLVLTPRHTHLVTVRPTMPRMGAKMGVAVYGPVRF